MTKDRKGAASVNYKHFIPEAVEAAILAALEIAEDNGDEVVAEALRSILNRNYRKTIMRYPSWQKWKAIPHVPRDLSERGWQWMSR